MNNKKILVFFVIIVVIIGLLYINSDKILKKIKNDNLRNQILNSLNNGESGLDLIETDIILYDYATKEATELEYGIDTLVETYVDFLKNCVLYKIGKVSIDEIAFPTITTQDMLNEITKFKNKSKDASIENNNDNILIMNQIKSISIKTEYIEFVANSIKEQDIKDYNENKFEDEIIKQLEKIFTHNSKNKYKDWYIKNKTYGHIDLPYGLYLVFVPNNKTNTNELWHAKDIVLSNETRSNENWSYDLIPSKLIYQNKDGDVKEISKEISFIKAKDKYSINSYLCSELFYTNDNEPEIIIGDYDYDTYKNKIGYTDLELEENEFNKRNNHSNKIIDETTIYIEKFDKYKSSAALYFCTYEDGHTLAEYHAVKGEKDNNGKIKRTYIKEVLPYKNMTKDNVLDLYLADTDRVKKNENDLKINNCFYNVD